VKAEHTETGNSFSRRQPTEIHWLAVAAIVLITALGIATTRYVSSEIQKNTSHNNIVLEKSIHTEAEAVFISRYLIPAFQALHSLDVAVNRHVAEFELYVLDSDRDNGHLVESLSWLQHAFDDFPEGSRDFEAIDQQNIREILGVFVDITYEALEDRSPNKLVQLLSDSEDVFKEFRAELGNIRRGLDNAVTLLGTDITNDLLDSRQNITLQQAMLKRLETISNWGLSLLIFIVLIVSIMLFRTLQRRLGAVAEYAHSIADGNYSASIDFVSKDKIGEMAESVSHMGDSLATLVAELGHKAEAAKRSAREARRLAYYDSLTGLANRQQFVERLEAILEKAQQSQEKVAVAYLDLDGFKKVNDSYGHNMGDQLLCAVADRLTHSMRDDDTVARSVSDSTAQEPSRLGGDEFTFLINRVHSRNEAEKVARRILSALDRPYEIGGRELIVTPSIGVAVYPEDGSTVSELLKHSDMAMYQAKESGRNNIKLYNAALSEQQIRMISLEQDLAKALEREELSLHYQAKIDLNSRQVVGAEALLRWRHPQRGMVSPVDFIPLAEESGLIISIGDWVLEQACSQLAEWKSDNIVPVPIAVNISAKQFAHSDLRTRVSECLKATEIGADFLELELTESALMADTERAIETLKELDNIGVKSSLDDFGTGYSSLSYLKKFPLSTLKIDRSFVRDIEEDMDDAAIVKAILALSKSLGLKVVAEGVENEQQADFLWNHGCQQAQGYLFSKPIPAQEFAELLVQSSSASVA